MARSCPAQALRSQPSANLARLLRLWRGMITDWGVVMWPSGSTVFLIFGTSKDLFPQSTTRWSIPSMCGTNPPAGVVTSQEVLLSILGKAVPSAHVSAENKLGNPVSVRGVGIVEHRDLVADLVHLIERFIEIATLQQPVESGLASYCSCQAVG